MVRRSDFVDEDHGRRAARMRADGQHNRQRLLDAAEELFAQRGTNVSVADIVAAAGVAAPTLYRHFGDKEGLIQAISERTAEIAMSRLAHALTRATGWEGLQVAIRDSVELARTNSAVREQSGVAVSAALERMLLSGWEELVERAHKEGSLRNDFAATDFPFLFAAVAAVGKAVDYEPELVERYIAILMEGMRPSSDRLPGRPPTLAELQRAFTHSAD